jgi:hypothetical protein
VTIDESEMKALVGHLFPGGAHTIAHWEDFLLTEATGSAALPDGLAHPVHLFHAPIAGAGISIAHLFELARAESDASVSIDYYDWELFEPLREGVRYDMSGGITEHERHAPEQGPVVVAFTYRIEVAREGTQAACVEFRWRFWRFES